MKSSTIRVLVLTIAANLTAGCDRNDRGARIVRLFESDRMKPSKLAFFLLSVATILTASCDRNDRGARLVGLLESDRIEITAEVSEPIIERAVTEGETVESGQLLITQDTARIETRLEEAEATLFQAQARLDELLRGPRREQILAAQASVRGAKKELEFREIDLERALEVFSRNLASSELRDRAQVSRDSAEANLQNLEARLEELLSGTTVEELRQAEEGVRIAEARLSALKIDFERHSAIAPASGVVDTLLFEAGERPQIGQPMVILLSGQQAYARIYVSEAMRVQVSPGTKARVFVDGMAETLDGSVRWISSDAAFTPYFALTEHDRGRLSYAAKVDINGIEDRLPDGVPVEVELLLNEKSP